ncbi:MAG: 4-hydroxy-tetrahydrodipicolinate reductase [Gemmatimonadales bacterium]
MKLGLLGLGRMGQAVDHLAVAANHEVVTKLDIDTNPGGDALRDALKDAEVVVDFTYPDAVVRNIEDVTAAGIPMVIGTTGWYDRMDHVRGIVESNGAGLVWAANFSIGAQILDRLAEHAAALLDRFAEYDPYVWEHHHRGKQDAPSGTAVRLADKIVAAMKRKNRTIVGNPDGQIPPDGLHVASVRAGEAFGKHTVGFDAASETVELTHTARGREGFARGALYAAEWIRGRTGFYEFSQLFDEVHDT